jgi:hypothetical protein
VRDPTDEKSCKFEVFKNTGKNAGTNAGKVRLREGHPLDADDGVTTEECDLEVYDDVSDPGTVGHEWAKAWTVSQGLAKPTHTALRAAITGRAGYPQGVLTILEKNRPC